MDGGSGGSLQLGTPSDPSQQHVNRDSGHDAGSPQSPPPPLLKDAEVYGFVGWIGTFVAYGQYRTCCLLNASHSSDLVQDLAKVQLCPYLPLCVARCDSPVPAVGLRA